ALRRWLVGGGRLWIMLDRVDPHWPEQVLGDSWNITVVDRVGLHRLTLEWEDETRDVQSDHGIRMVRTLVPDDVEVLHRVGGYPASMRRPVGRGELLVTTLGPEAWLDPPDEQAEDDNPVASKALGELRVLFSMRDLSEEHSDAVTSAFRPFVTDQIGYSILDRGSVASVLAVFIVALIAAGTLLAWRGRLEMIGVVGAATAIVAAAVLYLIGLTHHGNLPPSIAEVQLADTSIDQPYARTESTVGIFLPANLGGDRGLRGTGGVMWPSSVDQLGRTFRLIWTDRNQWEIPPANASLGPRTVHTLSGEHAQRLDTPVYATLRFNDDGTLVGHVRPGPYTQWEDGVVATAQGRMAVRFEREEGDESERPRFEVRPQRLGDEQFIAGGTVTTEQQRRQRIYRTLAETRGFPPEPMLLAWVGGGTTGIDLAPTDETSRRSGETLLIAPLRVQRPAPGTRLTVPESLMRVTRARDVASEYRSISFYTEDSGWNYPLRFPTKGLMRYQPPTGVGRLAIESATVTLDLRAPGWPFELFVMRNGRERTVHRGEGSTGPITVELAGNDVPMMNDDGSFYIGLSMIAPPGTASDTWALRRMGVSITGTARPAPSRGR
ncbi:MAG: hypothetical protein ACODAQ_10880, partial [Phycisphaeraceae bacterium]